MKEEKKRSGEMVIWDLGMTAVNSADKKWKRRQKRMLLWVIGLFSWGESITISVNTSVTASDNFQSLLLNMM